MSTHEGHRQRLKRRFLQSGLDGFDEAHVLELLLFYAIPRRDTAPLAKALLEEFGSLANVLEAPPEILGMVPGVGENAAALICLTTALSRYYLTRRVATGNVLHTVELCGEYLLPRFYGLRDEAVCALSLDGRCKVLSCRILCRGSVNTTGVSIRRIVEFALATGATSMVLAHNHPGGYEVPSADDAVITGKLMQQLDVVGIALLDHIIVAQDRYLSMRATGRMPRLRNGSVEMEFLVSSGG